MKWRSVLLWIISILLMMAMAVYQRTTGPSYPKDAEYQYKNATIHISLPTSADNDADARVIIPDSLGHLKGYYTFRKLNSGEAWTKYQMHREEDGLIATLPAQPAAGKLEYKIYIKTDGEAISLREDPVVIRFKGPVPVFILVPHILFMFLAMVFSMRTGFEAIFRGEKTFRLAGFTIIFLLLGGLILGPLVQYHAFGELWAGWPFGKDLTDNKTAIAFIFWLIAWFKLRKDPKNRFWPILASVVLLAIYLIPHSMFGSELDYSTGEVATGK